MKRERVLDTDEDEWEKETGLFLGKAWEVSQIGKRNSNSVEDSVKVSCISTTLIREKSSRQLKKSRV